MDKKELDFWVKFIEQAFVLTCIVATDETASNSIKNEAICAAKMMVGVAATKITGASIV